MTDLPSFSAIIVSGREVPSETFEVDGRLERHIEGCSCTTLHMRWPCEDVTP